MTVGTFIENGRTPGETSATAEAMLTTRGRSFYWARHLLGPVHAERATRLYGFCRFLDDLADEAPSRAIGSQSLDEVRSAIIDGYSLHPVVADGLDLMEQCGIPSEVVLELIKGIRSDLDDQLITDDTQLLRYCYRVAGTVGLMMCHVLDVKDPAAYRHAIDLGIGMQLTNICRDVAEDALLGRRYLPASLVGEVTPAALVDPDCRLQPDLRAGLAALLATAERYYQSGENGLGYLPANTRHAIRLAARLYRAIGRKLHRRNYAYWQGRSVVSPSEKILLTAQALCTVITKPRQHDATLHLALTGMPGTSFGCPSDHAA